MNVAILGATSHIAKGLIERFLARGTDRLYLFSRSPEKVEAMLAALGPAAGHATVCGGYARFTALPYDLLVNCVGVETRNKQDCDFTRYFNVTEEFDNLAIGYLLRENRQALYVSISSGAVYGRGFASPACDDWVRPLPVNALVQEDYYGIARLNAETKHRAHDRLRIVDLRVFSYFSRHIALADGYFITDLLQAILGDRVLVTDDSEMMRDYVHPDDLFALIQRCAAGGMVNDAFDVRSAAPVSKQEVLDYFCAAYGLRYERRSRLSRSSATGAKHNYYSVSNKSARLGYVPAFTSLDTLRHEARYILRGRTARGEGRDE